MRRKELNITHKHVGIKKRGIAKIPLFVYNIFMKKIINLLKQMFMRKHSMNKERNARAKVAQIKTDIIAKYTDEYGNLDRESLLLDVAIQNKMIIDSLEKIKNHL